MSITGIAIDDSCIQAWEEIKIKHLYRYIIFDFTKDLKKVIVSKKADRNATYDDFLDDLPPKDVRYAVYDYDFKADDGTDRNKLVFVVWGPDAAPARRKMIITGTKAGLKAALSGISMEFQANDDSDIQESEMRAKCVSSAY
ncbi:Cofilin/tropomyosin-type actin-binding protein [Trichomonas vaginalis G3]|uniref:Cofilin/tropomyosin-type actin-binding protein n=6 Tax=Trichomonas vaginalis TaxID=5722 RepID=A2DGX6_TRIV3|nr:actin filament depolymerization [Trichomonas vaginalis G3]EAY20286.1 Cofilin/tropomyosin-type actin-binding protein [Trichomonas vaginalis G3]KAI5529158.1 actin filament depolymerization [Trichomonas vaginalis G3]|eukprot:XP_001581272.1 Cofilin/tropomyosin-type actin-binding protein [Trichomonas vaginalis G3]